MYAEASEIDEVVVGTIHPSSSRALSWPACDKTQLPAPDQPPRLRLLCSAELLKCFHNFPLPTLILATFFTSSHHAICYAPVVHAYQGRLPGIFYRQCP